MKQRSRPPSPRPSVQTDIKFAVAALHEEVDLQNQGATLGKHFSATCPGLAHDPAGRAQESSFTIILRPDADSGDIKITV